MHFLRTFLIIFIIYQLIDQNQCEDKNETWFRKIGNLFPSFSSKKKEEPKKSESSSWFSSSKEKEKEKPKKEGWLFSPSKETEKPKESNSWFGSNKKDDKKATTSSGWFSNFKILSNLISSKDLNELPADDTLPKNASKSNLWEFTNLNLTNFNFSFVNLSNLPKLNSSSLLNLNNSKDWFINLTNLKAKYYGTLLDSNRTTTNSFDKNQTSNTRSIIESSTVDISIKPNTTTTTTISTTTTTTTTSIVNTHSIKHSTTNSIKPSSNNDTTNFSSMNFTLFRDRLIKVYDNLTFCEHPCNGKRIKKETTNITINGCGPSYFSDRQLSMIPFGEFFKDCCDFHDTKYADCGFRKQEADYNFLDCMLNLINKTNEQETANSWPRIQKTFGYALFGMVDLFGCKAWSISQKEVCDCD